MGGAILNFPNEVLLHIISQTPNADLDNLTSTCRFVRNLAGSALRDHRERKKTYAKITYGDSEHNEKRATRIHPISMLRDLYCDDLLCYPTKLSINCHRSEVARCDSGRYHPGSDGSDRANHKSEVFYALEHFPKDIAPLVKGCPYIGGDEQLTCEILQRGDIGATLGLLLSNLPRLTDLEMIDYHKMSDGSANLKQVLDRIANPSNTSILDAQGDSTKSRCKLKNITLTRSDEGWTHTESNLSMLAPLFYTPSVRSIRVEYLRAHEEVWKYPELHSPIEMLDFYQPETNIRSMNTYLGAVKNLTDFRYGSGHGIGVGRIPLTHLVRSLAIHAGHSLRHLELSDEFHDSTFKRSGGLYIGSLKIFSALQSIQIEGSMLIKPDTPKGRQGNPQQLTDILPVSIMYITLSSTPMMRHDLDMTVAIHGLRDLPARKAEVLPSLKIINLGFSVPNLEGNGMTLFRACREAGVTITNMNGALN